MRELTLLIDGDIVLFQASAAEEEKYDWQNGTSTVYSDPDRIMRIVRGSINNLVVKLKATGVIVALSDPKKNFRKKILSTYKENRKGSAKPSGWADARKMVEESDYRIYARPTLEGDDVMGILATHPTLVPGKKIVVSIDKDMETVPCTWYNPNQPEKGPQKIDEDRANYFHMFQTLTGDQVDNYKGCPRIGPVKATDILEGLTDPADMWDAVVETYVSKGLTEAHALTQARCARILRHTDYDFKKKEPILWTPPQN